MRFSFSDFFGGVQFRGNIYWVLIQRLLLAMFLFTLCRIGFYLYNTEFFPGMTLSNFLTILAGGLRFDLTIVLYLNLLMIVMMIIPFDFRYNKIYQGIIKYKFFVLNGAAMVANLADFIYYKFTLRRTTADIFKEFEEGPAGGVFFQFLFDYWHVTVFFIALVIIMVYLYNKIELRGPFMNNRIAYYSLGVLAIPLIAYLVIGGGRGGFRHSTRPITLSNAGAYVSNPNETNIVLNTPFSVFRTMKRTQIQKVNFFETLPALDSIYTPVHTPTDTIPFTNENVVIIILESFSREFIGALNKDKKDYTGYTPFLDSLIQHSKTFEYSFANGRKSIDGPPAAVAGMPSLGSPFVLTAYANNRYQSLASILREKGYHTSFSIGHPNGAMGYTAFTRTAGFEDYYGLDEYGNSDDYDGIWGIWDHKFFPFFVDKINENKKPFFATLFSTSSHHPFKVPAGFEGRFKGGEQPILKCVEYTDYALKEMFAKMAKEPWFKNTLFVITADHCSSDIVFDESRTTWGLFAVPVIFYKPDNSLAGHEHAIVQQTDIMPSVLGYLHYDKPYLAFGRDIFREQTEPMAFNFRDMYNLLMDDYLLTFDGKTAIGLYNFKTDKFLKENIIAQQQEVVQRMEQKIKAILQQHNNRLIENKLLP